MDKIKRIFDIAIAIFTIGAMAPLFLTLIVVVKKKLGEPVFYKQERAGKDGKSFTLLKFRTMTDEKDGKGKLMPDAERLTSIGRFLRTTSLDELPEIFNILKGDMSLVGPRPLLMQYLERYTPKQARRHEVRPGLTGWAQVNGRNALIWEEKFKLDVWYVDNQCFWLDIKILFMTISKVLEREGINHAGQVTMTEFMGSPNEITGGESIC